MCCYIYNQNAQSPTFLGISSECYQTLTYFLNGPIYV